MYDQEVYLNDKELEYLGIYDCEENYEKLCVDSFLNDFLRRVNEEEKIVEFETTSFPGQESSVVMVAYGKKV